MMSRSIPVFHFPAALLKHGTYGALMPQVDPREQAVLPADADAPYRATPESTARAIKENAKERAIEEAKREDFQIKREKAMNALGALVGEFGFPLVQGWLHHVGRAERP